MSNKQITLDSQGNTREMRDDWSFARSLTSEATRKHERAESARHAATIQAMREDRSLGLGRYYGPECYNGSPGWWRAHVRKAIKHHCDDRMQVNPRDMRIGTVY